MSYAEALYNGLNMIVDAFENKVFDSKYRPETDLDIDLTPETLLLRVIAVANPDDAKEIKWWHLKTMHHLSTAFQTLMVYKLTTQKT